MDTKSFIFDNLSTAVMLFDQDLSLKAANPAAEALLETSEKKVLGRSPEGIFTEASYWGSILRWALEVWRPFTERGVELRKGEADAVTVDCTVTPCATPGNFVGLLLELIPTERYQRISQEEQMLAQHQVAHSMVRGLAHEIRNPLGGLRGAAQLLARELRDPELEEYTEVIIGEADRLQALLDRLLGPRVVPRRRSVNVHQVTQRVCKLVRAEAPEGISLGCDYDPSIPDLEADPDLLIQALLNVARNAVQAVGEKGHIQMRSRIERQVTLGHERHRLAVRLDIIDDGPGIPADMLDKVFYPMVSGRPEGSGLGLSIAQNLIHQHGGLIQCRSRPGKTVMSTVLPIKSEHS